MANGRPSVLTQPFAVPSLLIALRVEVDSHATYVPGRLAAFARALQNASALACDAAAELPNGMASWLAVTNMRFAFGRRSRRRLCRH